MYKFLNRNKSNKLLTAIDTLEQASLADIIAIPLKNVTTGRVYSDADELRGRVLKTFPKAEAPRTKPRCLHLRAKPLCVRLQNIHLATSAARCAVLR